MPSEAADFARVLFGQFRATDLNDPRVFATGVAAVLCRYPRDVVARVCGPGGLAQTAKFLPSIAEVKSACDAEMAPILRQRERERRHAESVALLAPPPRPTEQERAAKLARLRARHGAHFGITPDGPAPPRRLSPEAEREAALRSLREMSSGSFDDFAARFDATPDRVDP